MDYYKTIRERLIESDNLGQFYIKRKLSCEDGVGSLKDDKGDVTNDNQSKASILNEYLALYSVGIMSKCLLLS